MSFCSKCGTKIENEKQQFCTNCGNKFETKPEISTPQIHDTPVYDQQTSVHSPVDYTAEQPIVQQPMKWFKFLIYFALFFGAFINFVFGFNYITGGIYFAQTDGQVTADMVYGMYGGGLKALDVLYGIIMIAIAGFGVFTRFRLAKYKADGPKCVYILYASGAVLTVIYNIALLAITGLNQIFTVSSATSFIVSALFVFFNYKYFTKRKELFTN